MKKRYQRNPVTKDGVRRDFGDHVIIRGEIDVHLPGGLWMAALIKDTNNASLQQYLMAVKSMLRRIFRNAGWSGEGDIRVLDIGPEPDKEVPWHRATYFAQDPMAKKIFVSLPKGRADKAMERLGISKVVDEL